MGTVHWVDVTNERDVTKAAATTVEVFRRVDLLVANAGIAGPNFNTWEYATEAWQRAM